MKIKTLFLVVFSLCSYNLATAATAPVQVLGLPLGGNVKLPIRNCKQSEIGAVDVKSICWVSPPFMYRKHMIGRANVPGSDARPLWAAHATFELNVSTGGMLNRVSAHTFSARDYAQVRQSVSSRFGEPTFIQPDGSTRAIWHLKTIHIELSCRDDHGCDTNFLTPELQAEEAAETIARLKKDAARPVTP
jgi:hypothetical protein